MSNNDAVLAQLIAESDKANLEYLRDDIALRAMERMLNPETGAEIYHHPVHATKLAVTAYAIADAMMKARYVEPIKVEPEVH